MCCNTAGANQKNIKAILATKTRQRLTWHDRGKGKYMSVKIKISYTDEQELDRIVRLLSPVVGKWKKQQAKGTYKRAYGESNHERSKKEA